MTMFWILLIVMIAGICWELIGIIRDRMDK
jgi:uncharacterized membrane protein YuzA (DUF378 family)